MTTLLASGFVASAKVLAAVKEIYVAYLFGVGDLLDAYLVALGLVTFFLFTIGGAMKTAFIPRFIRLTESNEHSSAVRLLQSVLCILWLGILVLSILLIVFSGMILKLFAPGFSESQRHLAQILIYILFPVLFFACSSSFLAGVLNAQGRYVFSGLASVMNSFVIMALLFFLGSQWGIYGLALSTTIGFAAEFIFLYVELCSIRLPPIPQWPSFSKEVRHVLAQYWPAAIGSLIMAQAPIIDQALATLLDPGSIAALNFGKKLPSLFLTIFATGLSASLLPHFSKMFSQHGSVKVVDHFYVVAKKVFLFSIPMVVVLLIGSKFFTQILFQRGQFTVADTDLVASITSCLALQIPFFLITNASVHALSALSMNRWLAILSVLNFFVNLIGDIILMKFFGVVGIALSTSLVYFIASLFILMIFARKKSSEKVA
ncbi:MAG: murein biosynthesis integral membrane protein MurJ [Verrucomicrobiota bacterium]